MTVREPDRSAPAAWLEQHSARAPEALRRRVARYVAEVTAESTVPGALACAADAALARVLHHPGDRSVALDLLAADALVTLALLAEAERSPEHLARFADAILRAPRPAS